MINFLINNYGKILKLLLDHIFITSLTFIFSLIIAVPISIISYKNNYIKHFVLKSFGLIYTIPSMAMFALFIPILGLGKKTAIISLIIYSQFILVKNIIKGLEQVPNTLIEAGKGMGFNSYQLLIKIKIPCAMPIFISGIRITIISIISLTTLSAWINAGGLGVLIFDGLYNNHIYKLLTGTLLTASLSLFFNFLLLKFESKLKIS